MENIMSAQGRLSYVPDPEFAELNQDLELMAEIFDKHKPRTGRELIVAICGEFNGTAVYFPSVERILTAHRNEWIRDQYDSGFRVPDIARAVGLGERQVWSILGRDPLEERQLKLF